MPILIDTRPLGLALKAPYYDEKHPVYSLAQQAQNFVREQIAQQILAVSPQLLSELHHVLTERGLRLPKALAHQLINDLLQADVFVVGAEAQKPSPQRQLNGDVPMSDIMRHSGFPL